MNKQTFVITFFNYAYEKSVKTHFQSIIYSLYKNKNIDNKIFFVNNKIYTFDNKYMIIMNNNDINIIQNNYKLLIQMISEYFNYIKDDIVDFDNIIFNYNIEIINLINDDDKVYLGDPNPDYIRARVGDVIPFSVYVSSPLGAENNTKAPSCSPKDPSEAS